MPTPPKCQHQPKYSPHCGRYGPTRGNPLAARCTTTQSPGSLKSSSGTVRRETVSFTSRHFNTTIKRICEWDSKYDALKPLNYSKLKMKRKLKDGTPICNEELAIVYPIIYNFKINKLSFLSFRSRRSAASKLFMGRHRGF